MIYFVQSMREGDFSGGPVVKTLPSSARRVGLISGQRAKIQHAPWLTN